MLTDELFINFLKENENVYINEEFASKFFQLQIKDIIDISIKLKDPFLKQLFRYPHLMNYNNFKLVFLKASDDLKKEIIKDESFFQYITSIYDNKRKISIFDLLSQEIKIDFLNNYNKIDNKIYISLLKRISDLEFDEVISKLNKKNLFDSNELEIEYIANTINVNKSNALNFTNKCNLGNRNINYTVKLKNRAQFNIYDKFNLFIEVTEDEDYYEFKNNVKIKKEIIEKINEKHVNKIINALKIKEVKKDDNGLFLSALYTYSIFGFSNALSIVEDKFTNINEASIERTAKTEYIDHLRQQRLENPNMFYSEELLKKAMEKISKKDYGFFDHLSKSEVDRNLLNKLYFSVLVASKSDLANNMKMFLKNIIQNREIKAEKDFIEKYKITYKNTLEPNVLKLDSAFLYRIFENIDLNKINYDDNGRSVVNIEMQKFLLGNQKKDNDCLLRLIINELAFGLNFSIDNIINNFDIISDIINKSEGSLSLYNILDVIDISKTLIYELKPDEQDITLDSISKLIKSSKYCTESEEDILFKSKELHKERKKKIRSTIPMVTGSTENVRYGVIKFDSPDLISIGIDLGNCFKIGGKGESFFEYCLTNENAAIIELYDQNMKFYACPFIRSGNGIYGNGIEPAPENDDIRKQLLDAIQDCTKKIINSSYEPEKIEFAAMMDLNQESFFESNLLETIKLDKNIIIDGSFYTDYYKEKNKCYIISSLNNKEIFQELYVPNEYYYQKRMSHYEYNLLDNDNKELIQTLINSIKYSSIDCEQVSLEKRDIEKRTYKNLCVDDYQYIIGNIDWFIAVDKCANMICYNLNYDPRSKDEYSKALSKVKKEFIDKNIEEKKTNVKRN